MNKYIASFKEDLKGTITWSSMYILKIFYCLSLNLFIGLYIFISFYVYHGGYILYLIYICMYGICIFDACWREAFYTSSVNDGMHVCLYVDT